MRLAPHHTALFVALLALSPSLASAALPAAVTNDPVWIQAPSGRYVTVDVKNGEEVPIARFKRRVHVAKWTFETQSDGSVLMRSPRGKYLGVDPRTGKVTFTTRSTPHPLGWHFSRLVLSQKPFTMNGKTYYRATAQLKTMGGWGLLVDKKGNLYAKKGRLASKFTMTFVNPLWTPKAGQKYEFVTGMLNKLVFEGSSAWTWIENTDGTVSLRNDAGKYLAVNKKHKPYLAARLGPHGRFTLEPVNTLKSRVRFRTVHGSLLNVQKIGGKPVLAARGKRERADTWFSARPPR